MECGLRGDPDGVVEIVSIPSEVTDRKLDCVRTRKESISERFLTTGVVFIVVVPTGDVGATITTEVDAEEGGLDPPRSRGIGLAESPRARETGLTDSPRV